MGVYQTLYHLPNLRHLILQGFEFRDISNSLIPKLTTLQSLLLDQIISGGLRGNVDNTDTWLHELPQLQEIALTIDGRFNVSNFFKMSNLKTVELNVNGHTDYQWSVMLLEFLGNGSPMLKVLRLNIAHVIRKLGPGDPEKKPERMCFGMTFTSPPILSFRLLALLNSSRVRAVLVDFVVMVKPSKHSPLFLLQPSFCAHLWPGVSVLVSNPHSHECFFPPLLRPKR